MIERLIDQMFWANSSMLEWLQADRKNQEEMIRLASHILNAETIWIRRARQEDFDRDTFKIHGLPALEALNTGNNAEYKALLGMDIKRKIDYRLIDGTPGRSSIEDMIIHVYSHGFHHRGQMAALASKAGEKFPNVAHIHYVRGLK